MTVLFADLKGSMELLADRDPEEARKILDPVLVQMMEAVHRYEGTVNQVMGDGIMALFGCGRATRPCGCSSQSRSTPKASSGRTGYPCRFAWGSTPAKSSYVPSAPTCTWTTRRWGRRRTWPLA